MFVNNSEKNKQILMKKFLLLVASIVRTAYAKILKLRNGIRIKPRHTTL